LKNFEQRFGRGFRRGVNFGEQSLKALLFGFGKFSVGEFGSCARRQPFWAKMCFVGGVTFQTFGVADEIEILDAPGKFSIQPQKNFYRADQCIVCKTPLAKFRLAGFYLIGIKCFLGNLGKDVVLLFAPDSRITFLLGGSGNKQCDGVSRLVAIIAKRLRAVVVGGHLPDRTWLD
jgi:hypothetical protein